VHLVGYRNNITMHGPMNVKLLVLVRIQYLLHIYNKQNIINVYNFEQIRRGAVQYLVFSVVI